MKAELKLDQAQSYCAVNTDYAPPERPLTSLLEETARNFPGAPAFDFMGSKWRWDEVDRMASRIAKGLQQKFRLQKGTRIGLCLPNTPYYLAAYYGILRAGGVVVNFNPLYAKREIAGHIADSGVKIMFTLDLRLSYDKLLPLLDDKMLDSLIVCPFAKLLPLSKSWLFRIFKSRDTARVAYDKRQLSFKDLTGNDGNFSAVEIDPARDAAVIQYTGGTTGSPKAAVLTHRNLLTNTDQCALWLGENARPGHDKMLGVIPFFHIFAMTAVMNMSVKLGLEILALPRFDLAETLKIIHRRRPQFFPAVPAIYSAIVNHHDLDRYDLSSVQTCIAGGAPLPEEVKRNFEAKTGCSLVEGYGLTEASPVLCCNPQGESNRPGTIGLPLPGTEIRLSGIESPETPVPQGERGELCARGPQVMKGYWNQEAETASVLSEDGWLRTGDVAVMDADGYYRIVDRIKDLIITNGYNVYPRNVEEAIYLHPDIAECVVGGVPHESRGEVVKAWVHLKSGSSLDEIALKEFLRDKLSPMEMPRRIEFRQEPLPKTLIGKLSRKALVDEEKGGPDTQSPA